MRKFTDKIVTDRITEFRKLSKDEISDMQENFGRGKVKRQMAFLDTLIYAMDVAGEMGLDGVRQSLS